MTEDEIKKYICECVERKLPGIVKKVLQAEAAERIDALIKTLWR